MAFTEIYVDPSLTNGTGSGTIGAPYGNIEYAIVQETFDLTNSTRINVKSGATDTLASILNTSFSDTSVSIAWVPGAGAELRIQGYNAAAGDGGKGDISGGGTVGIIGSNIGYVSFMDMHLHNTGTVQIATCTNNYFIRCEFSDCSSTTGNGMVNGGLNTVMLACEFHDMTGSNCMYAQLPAPWYCYFHDGAGGGPTTRHIYTNKASLAYRNVITTAGNADGIHVYNGGVAANNTLYSTGTGSGIDGQFNQFNCFAFNNVVQGYAVGIDGGNTQAEMMYAWGNSVYNSSTTDLRFGTNGGRTVNGIVDAWKSGTVTNANESLGATPFTTVSLEAGDFSLTGQGDTVDGHYPLVVGNGV